MQLSEQEFNRIKSGDQTILLCKINHLNNFFNAYDGKINEFTNGRFQIALQDDDYDTVGMVSINGYSIIPNYFNELAKKGGSNYPPYQKKFLTDTFKTLNKINLKWIIENVKYLTEQFKNENEILILNIESVE